MAAAIPSGHFGGDPGRLLTTFLGLVAASILPTISLLVGSMSPVGRSVKGIGQLHDEFAAATTDLWAVLVLVALSVVGLTISSIPFDHTQMTYIIRKTTIDVAEIVLRFGQATVGGATAAAVFRFGQVPRVLRRILEIRYQIAVEEARRKIEERAPNADRVAAIFPTKAGFGDVRASLTSDQTPTT